MENKEKKAQEMYMEYQMVDQRIKKLQAQLESVTGQLMELDATSSGLDEFGKIKGEREILLPLSSGIFARARIKDTSELLVNVGANVIVRKDILSAKKLISGQMEEIKKVQKKMADEMEKMAAKAGELEMKLQEIVSKE